MKKIITLCWIMLATFAAVSCTPDNADDLNGDAIPKAADLEIEVAVDQTTNYATFTLKNAGMMPIWIFSESEQITQNNYQRRYRRAGTYSVEVKAYNRNGISDGSRTVEFTLDNDYSATNPLYGAGSKSWVIDATADGHFGCGESVDNPTGWYAAAANDKAGTGLYDNVLTFNSDGTYSFAAGGEGKVFVNAGVTLLGENTSGQDASIAWDDYSSTYEFDSTTLTFPQQSSPKYTVVGYVPNDEYLTASSLQFTIKSLTDECMELVWYTATGNGGGPIAWYMRYVPQGGVQEKSPLYGTGSKVWKIASMLAGHLGCGPDAAGAASWWAAAPDEKAAFGIYDDRVTFSEDGTYIYNPGVDGKTYINYGCTRFNTIGAKEDFDMDNVMQTTTYELNDKMTSLTFPAQTFLPYVASDGMYDKPEFTVTELTTDKLVLVWATTNIAWQIIFVPESYTGEPAEEAFDKGAELETSEYRDGLNGSWTWESTTLGHFGCGETIAAPTAWWNGGAGAKEGCSMYDDVMTFGSDGSYKFDPVDGMTYKNGGVTDYTGELVDKPLGDDDRVKAEVQQSTFTYAATTEAGFAAFTLPAGTLFSYIANNDQLGAHTTYYITGMWENQVEISWYTPTGNGGGSIAWRYRLKRVK